MTVWRGEVNVDSVGRSLPGAGLFPLLQAAYAGASYVFTCEDVDPLAGNTQLYVKVNQIHDREVHGAPGGNFYFTRMTAGSFLPFTGDPYLFVIFDSSGQFQNDTLDGGTLFGGGGLLSIEKDTTTGSVTFTSPAGTWVTTTAVLGIAMTTQIRPLSIGLLLQVQDIPPASNSAQSLTVNFSHVAGKKDGVTISGAAMSTADPGMWSAWTESALFSPLIDATFMQQATSEQADLNFPIDPTPSFGAHDDGWYRIFQGPDHMAAPLPLDLTTMREHNILFGAWNRMPTNLTVRRSHNQGASWFDTDAENGALAESISIQCWAGEVWVCYYDGTNIVTQRSIDLGNIWSPAVAVSITGTNPRLVIAPDGTQFYFYMSGGNLLLSRSTDLGVTLFDAVPIVVASTVTAQDFGAVLAADRTLTVSYIGGGNWVSRRSIDWGLTWSTM